jgi:conjugal transfer pilus assembly protein TraV
MAGHNQYRSGRRRRSVASVICATMLLAACSSLSIGEGDFSCPGMPSGVRCQSARQVYEDAVSGRVVAAETRTGAETGIAPPTDNQAIWPITPDDRRIPVRTPAVVMRVWVAPYEDKHGDLHLAGLIFTEIERRTWEIGAPGGGAPSNLKYPLAARTSQSPPSTGKAGSTSRKPS